MTDEATTLGVVSIMDAPARPAYVQAEIDTVLADLHTAQSGDILALIVQFSRGRRHDVTLLPRVDVLRQEAAGPRRVAWTELAPPTDRDVATLATRVFHSDPAWIAPGVMEVWPAHEMPSDPPVVDVHLFRQGALVLPADHADMRAFEDCDTQIGAVVVPAAGSAHARISALETRDRLLEFWRDVHFGHITLAAPARN